MRKNIRFYASSGGGLRAQRGDDANESSLTDIFSVLCVCVTAAVDEPLCPTRQTDIIRWVRFRFVCLCSDRERDDFRIVLRGCDGLRKVRGDRGDEAQRKGRVQGL